MLFKDLDLRVCGDTFRVLIQGKGADRTSAIFAGLAEFVQLGINAFQLHIQGLQL